MSETSHHSVRAFLVDELRKDLVGPSSPLEELTDRPSVQYLTGILFPRASAVQAEEDNDANDAPDQDDDHDTGALIASTFNPSVIGLSFAVPRGATLSVACRCAEYERSEEGEGELWRRRPVDLPAIPVETHDSRQWRQRLREGLELFVRVRCQENHGVVTVSLANVRTSGRSDEQLDALCFFQPEIEIAVTHPESASFLDRSAARALRRDPETLSSMLLFRHVAEYAVGHGCAVTWEADDQQPPRILRTQVVPAYEVPALTPSVLEDLECLDMDTLASEQGSRGLTTQLARLVAAYHEWIELQESKARDLPEFLQAVARSNLEMCREVARRIEGGVQLLREDADALRAFRLANLAMLRQRDRVEWMKAPRDERGTAPAGDIAHRWRAFQLAFILLVMPSIADEGSPEREWVDLLWFPTGGGKTEAYLALAGFAIFLRRLRGGKRPEAGGVTALMRYTLRLLTLQQFQRAATLIMACELIRRDDEGHLGQEPISLGLWVGAGATPNWLREAREALRRLNEDEQIYDRNPYQLLECPWCGTRLTPRHYHVSARMEIRCPNEGCEFAGGMPLYLVDEDVYNLQPSLVIATVDKFARLPWLSQGSSLFGGGSRSRRTPALIIQDELHLISGPLGSLVGLYETAVDALAGRDGALPKVIASTATIHRASDQVAGLYARRVCQFPPAAIDSRDTFFAREISPDEAPGRLFVGVHAAGKSVKTALLRTYALLLQRVYDHRSDLRWRDPYWTLVGYFNSLRELGGARRLVDDDVRARILGVATRVGERSREIEAVRELTSRAGSSEIPEILQELSAPAGQPGALDVLLATNMISVGVDVDRLGLMVVNGQPKTTSEYIQATSRIGRVYPGLVVTLYNWTRPRDRSHYERFRTYHAALYRHVEASSVTPFSSRARDRGLHAVFITLVRHLMPSMNAEDAAGLFAPEDEGIVRIREIIAERAGRVDPDETEGVLRQLEGIADVWSRLARAESLRYGRDLRNPDLPHLMEPMETCPEDFAGFRVLNSLREVEGEAALVFLREGGADA